MNIRTRTETAGQWFELVTIAMMGLFCAASVLHIAARIV